MNVIFGWQEGSKEGSTCIKKAGRSQRARAAIGTLLPEHDQGTKNPAPFERVRGFAVKILGKSIP